MKQSRTMALIEAITNVVVGYALAVATQSLVFPMFGWQPNLQANLSIALLFSLVSLVRSYLLRRLFCRLNEKRTSRSWSSLRQVRNPKIAKQLKISNRGNLRGPVDR